MDLNEKAKLFNHKLCIICQKIKKTVDVSSTANGICKIRLVADTRRDDVYRRVLSLREDGKFFCVISTTKFFLKLLLFDKSNYALILVMSYTNI